MWMTPDTLAAGEFWSAAWMNTYLRDNMLEQEVAKASAAGDLFYADRPNHLVRLPIGDSTKTLVMGPDGVPEWGNIEILTYKTEDESRTGDSQTNDKDFWFEVLAGETWIIELILIVEGHVDGDLRYNFTLPNAFVHHYWVGDIQEGVIAPSAVGDGENSVYGNPAADVETPATITTYFRCVLQNGDEAGEWHFKWAQNVPNATPTYVKAGSLMRRFKV